jgi:multiple sugar transport system substrate-binding protein
MRLNKTKCSFILGLIAALVLCIVFAGCSSLSIKFGKPADKSITEIKKEPEKLTMWVRTPETLEILNDAAVRFQAETGNHIDILSIADGQYQASLQAAISGNQLPDIFQTHYAISLAQLNKLGLIQPLPFTEEFLGQFDPSSWWEGSTTLGGEVYGWPDRSFIRGSLVMFYNKKVMKDAGLHPDSPPVTWEQFLEQSKQVTQQSGEKVYGATTALKSDWFAERLVAQLATTVEGGGIYMESLPGKLFDWKTGNAFTAAPALEALNFLEKLKNGKVINPDFVIMDRPNAAAQFGENQAAFLFDGHWRLKWMKENYPELEFGLAPLPSKTGALAYWGVEGGSSNAFVVSKKSKNADVAVKWFEYLSKYYYPKLLEKSIDLTPIPSINNLINIEMIPEFKQLIQLYDKIVKMQPSPSLRNPVDIEVKIKLLAKTSTEPLGQTVQAYLSGKKMDIDKYMNDYATEQQQFLEDALKAVAGAKKEDWIFKNWRPSDNYTLEKYKN